MFRHPLCFQASENALHRCVIPAVATAAHALFDPVAPQYLPELDAGVMATLVRVKHQLLRTTTGLKGHAQGARCELRVRSIGECPAHDAARIQIHNRRQVNPAITRPDVGHVAAPHLVGAAHCELPIQLIRRDSIFTISSTITMLARLRTEQPGLFHQASGQKTHHRDTLYPQRR